MQAITAHDDNSGSAFYFGGKFKVAGDVIANNIVRWDGVEWNVLAGGVSGPTSETKVSALLSWQGRLIVGGSFTSAGGIPATNIALWNGSTWEPLADGTDGPVFALTLFNDDLVVGGAFSSIGGVGAHGLARWDGAAWHSFESELSNNATVQALKVHNGRLIVAGSFTLAGNEVVNNIVEWDGAIWHSFGNGVGGNVRAIEAYHGDVVVAGDFLTAGGQPANRIARWNSTGESWTPLGEGVYQSLFNCSDQVHVSGLAVYEDQLLATGCFLRAGSVLTDGLAAWDGTTWSSIPGWPGARTYLSYVYLNDLYVGVDWFPETGRTGIVRFDSNSWHSFASGLGGSWAGISAFEDYNNSLIIGGDFNSAGDTQANGIVSWNDGQFTALDQTAGIVFPNDIASYGNELIVGGNFCSIGDVETNKIAAWNEIAWHDLDGGVGCCDCSQEVMAITRYQDQLIAGGYFHSIGGQVASRVARWDGDSWHSLGDGIPGPVRALTVYENHLIAGTYDGLYEWNGESWDWLTPGFEGVLLTFVEYHGDLVAAGLFTSVEGIDAQNIARWDGNQWFPIGTGNELQSWDGVYALEVLNGQLIAGGSGFPDPLINLARWDGLSWTPFDGSLVTLDGETVPTVYALKVIADEDGGPSSLFVGGYFSMAGGVPSHGIARWGCVTAPPAIDIQPHDETVCLGDGAQFSVTAHGSDPIAFQWRKNGIELVDSDNLTGTATPTLLVQAASPSDAGFYSCVVTNAFESVLSSSAELEVQIDPIVAELPDSFVVEAVEYAGPTPVLLQGSQPVNWTLVAGPAEMTINSYTGVVRWPLPTPAGSPHMITIHAANASCDGSDESWNLYVLSAPDFVVSEVEINVFPFSYTDQTFQVSWNVANASSVDADVEWVDHVYYSPDEVFGNGNDTPLSPANGVPYGDGLPAGATYPSPRVREFLLPHVPGDYWILVKTDAANDVWEGFGEGNNVGIADANPNVPGNQPIHVMPAPLPDLIVSEVVPPIGQFGQNPLSGTNTEITYTVTNVGNAPTPNSHWNDLVFISRQTNITWSGIDGNDQIFCNLDPPSIDVPNAQSLAPGDSYTQVVEFNLPQDEVGEWYVYVLADRATGCHPGWSLVESNKENNILFEGPFQVDLAPQPDMAISDVTLGQTTIFSGSQLTITWIDVNQGEGPSDCCSWWDQAYLSSNDSLEIEPDDIPLGDPRVCNGILNPHEERQCSSISRQIPIETPTGDYIIKVLANSTDHVTEFGFENNNVSVSAINLHVFQTPPVDLLPTAVVAPESAIPGHLMNISWSAENDGFPPTLAMGWVDAVYLSEDETFDPGSDHLFGTFGHATGTQEGQPTLDPYMKTRLVRLPNATPAGPKFVIVCVDSNDTVFEGNNGNSNNCLASDPIQVVLQPTDLRPGLDENHPAPLSAAAGQSFQFFWTVENAGEAVTPVSTWRDRVLLSSDAVVGGNDSILATVQHVSPLEPGTEYLAEQGVMIPYRVPGSYYLLVQSDFENSVYEQAPFENNNLIVAPFTITSDASDLVITNFAIPSQINSGELIHLEWTVQNQGTLTTSAANWLDRVVLSTNGTLGDDIELGSRTSTGVLGTGESKTMSADFVVPVSLTGMYYVIKCTDSTNVVFETNESNNCFVKPVTVDVHLSPWPDLIVSNVTAPNMVAAGQSISVEWTVSNAGPGPSTETTWRDSVYLSLDQFYDAGVDRFIGHRDQAGPLGEGTNYTIAQSFGVPTSLEGSYYVFVVTDAGTQVFENEGENNNDHFDTEAIQISIPPPADLAVAVVTHPDSAALGDEAAFTWQVLNAGNNPVNGSWKDSLYLSSDNVWDITDVRIGSFYHVPDSALNPGDFSVVTHTAAIPGVLPGAYHVLVRADIFNQIPESQEDNNLGTSPGTLLVSATPLDLGVPYLGELAQGDNAYFSLQVSPGQTIQVTLEHSSDLAWTELYIKHATIPTPGDFDFFYNQPNQPLQTITIPEALGGVYYLLAKTAFNTPGSGNSYTILADALDFSITSVQPHDIGAGPVTLRVSGARFIGSMEFSLRHALNGDLIVSQDSTIESLVAARAFFDLGAASLGSYDVMIRDPITNESRVLPAALVVDAPTTLEVTANVLGLSAVRKGTASSATLVVTNEGNINIPVTVIRVGALGPVGITATLSWSTSEGTSNVPFVSAGLSSVPFKELYLEGLAPGEHVVLPITISVASTYSQQSASIIAHASAQTDAEFLSNILLPDIHRTLIASREHLELPPLSDAEFLLLLDSLLAQRESDFFTFGIIAPTTAGTGGRRSQKMSPVEECASSCDWQAVRCGTVCGVLSLAGPEVAPAAVACAVYCSAQLVRCTDCCSEPCLWYCPAAGSEDCAPTCEPPYSIPEGTACPYLYCGEEALFLPAPFPEISDPFEPGSGFWVCVPYCYPNFGCFATPQSWDPNDKSGPMGVGENQYVSSSASIQYRVRFENLASATASAARVLVTDVIDPDLDLTTARLGDIYFGQTSIAVPTNVAQFQSTLSPLGVEGILLEIAAGIDVANRQVFWLLQSIDANTGQPPTDPNLGFLPPEDGTGRGMGAVHVMIAPAANTPTGTIISNKAHIQFDLNEPIATNEVTNTIDAVPPSSSVHELPPTWLEEAVLLRWIAEDEQPGAGVGSVSIYVSMDGGPFMKVAEEPSFSETVYYTSPGHTYSFYSRALDLAGNEEEVPLLPDAYTITPIAIIASTPPNGAIDARQPINLDGSNPTGWSTIALTFSANAQTVMASDFQIVTTRGDTPVLIGLTVDGSTAYLALDRPISPGAWTTIYHTPSDTRICLGYLPGDVNHDGVTNPIDILATIDAANGVLTLPLYSTDIDRSGAFTPADILRVIDLINGADALESWLAFSIGNSPCG